MRRRKTAPFAPGLPRPAGSSAVRATGGVANFVDLGDLDVDAPGPSPLE
jgi:hypothetical protein